MSSGNSTNPANNSSGDQSVPGTVEHDVSMDVSMGVSMDVDTSNSEDELLNSLIDSLHSVLDYYFTDNSSLRELDIHEERLRLNLPSDGANIGIGCEEHRVLQYVLDSVDDVMDRAQTLLYYLTTTTGEAGEYVEPAAGTLSLLQLWRTQREHLDTLLALVQQQEPESTARFIALAYSFPTAPNA